MALSVLPVAADPGTFDAGKRSTPPRPVDAEVIVGAVLAVAWLRPRVLDELRLPRESPVEVVVV